MAKLEDNPNSIKYYVKRYLLTHANVLKGKKIVDFPAGNGVTSRILKDIGAEPISLDLFPEYFELEDIECIRANIMEGLPLEEESVDGLICQEGIEHFSNQYGAMKEFNRVIKPNGTLLITTPNYSNLKAKISYLLAESERLEKKLAPNELDSINMSNQSITNEVYFGHIFLIGIQKLRTLGKLAGFKIIKCHTTKTKLSSVLLLVLLYPLIFLTNWRVYRRSLRKKTDFNTETKKATYGEIFRLSINPRILTSSHLMIEFTKEQSYQSVANSLKSKHKGFNKT